MSTNAIVIGGSGTPVTAGTTNTPASSVQVLSAIATSFQPLKSAQAVVSIQVTYAPPSPVGTFKGVWVYLDAPDTSMGLAIADGTQPADGTTPALGTFNPKLIRFVDFNPNLLQFTFELPAPASAQLWRVYLVSGSSTIRNTAIQFGQPGASPSLQFYVAAASPLGSANGREFAPLIQDVALAPTPVGWTANPNIFTVDSGDQDVEFAIQWQWPTSDPTINTLGGFNLVIDDGHSQKYITFTYTPSVTNFSLLPFSVLPGTTQYTLWFLSYDANGQSNTLVAGVTPRIQFTVTRSLGALGSEYCALVLPLTGKAFVTAPAVTNAADGSADLQVDGWFTRPTDPSWGGAEVVVLKPDGNYYSVTKGTLAPIENFISNPASVQTWAFFVRSIDINGRFNTVQPQISFSGGGGSGAVAVATVVAGVITAITLISGGTGYSTAPTVAFSGSGTGASVTATVSGGKVNGFTSLVGGSGYIATPMVTISVGSATGLLNLAQAVNTSFAAQFAIIGSVFTVQTLDAALIKTGLLSVGGGSGMPGQIQVFDGFSSLIAWIGYSSPYAGGWFKQLYVGGASPASAPLVADPSGNVTIDGATFALTRNNITTSMSNGLVGGVPVGLKVTNNITGHNAKMAAEFINLSTGSAAVITLSQAGTGGAGLVDIADSTGASFLQFDGGASTALTASTGAGALPANPAGFFPMLVGGVPVKVAFWNP